MRLLSMGLDKSNDKLTLVLVGGDSNLTTQEFDSIENIEVTSNPFNGTQIFFVSPASSDDSGTLTLSVLKRPLQSQVFGQQIHIMLK